jgi:filamentous hemagglutinin family protein
MDCEWVRKRQQERSAAIALLLWLSSLSPFVFGGGVTDGSVGPVQSLSGNFTVPQSLGSLKGNNLFHSFARFNIDAGESGTFTTQTGSIHNVISRVTGGEASAIHGLLKLQAAVGSRPDFYFINPAGVVFGAGAQVDVPAGLHVSTAQRLKFADGFAWDTTAPTVSALTVASPEAFGFVGSQSPASVLLHNKDAAGNRASDPTNIELKPSSAFSITAGAVEFDSANVSVSEGGQIRIKASGDLSILNGSVISSSTSSDKAAGSIDVDAASLLIDRGEIKKDTGIRSQTEGAGDAAQVKVKVSGLSILHGNISSETNSSGSAGVIDVEAGEMTINGLGLAFGIFNEALSDSSGPANSGRVHVKVAGQLSFLEGGQISSSTFSREKPAGSVDVEARALTIDVRQQPGKASQSTGIFSTAGRLGAEAGRIKVIVADELSIFNGGEISSDSESGAAGSIDVQARFVEIAGFKSRPDGPSRITSKAQRRSSGRPGNVSVTTDRLELRNGGSISIENLARVSDPTAVIPGTISVSSGNIVVEAGGEITAASEGNVAASNIEVDFTDLLILRDAAITTTAKDGDGGTIRISGGRGILLDRSQVTTSAENGNGGDITIRASALAMDTGFIQANTAAPRATGGNVLVDVDTLVASGNTLALGGDIPFSFQRDAFALNVIQAAAPEGVSGRVDVTSPALDIAGSLTGLSAELIASGTLGKDLCRVGAGSSFTPVGRGGLRPAASGMIRPEGAFALASVGAGDVRWRVAESSEAAVGPLGPTTSAPCR